MCGSTSKSENRRASSTSKRVALRILRVRDRTGAMRAVSGAIGTMQAPTSARAIRLQGPQTGALRAHGARGRGTGFEALRAAAHRKPSEKMLSSATDPSRTRTSHQPALLAGSHPGKVMFMLDIDDGATQLLLQQKGDEWARMMPCTVQGHAQAALAAAPRTPHWARFATWATHYGRLAPFAHLRRSAPSW